MKRHLKFFMLLLTVLCLVLACQDTSDSSSNTNSGTADGGNGNNSGGTSLDSEIINATMRVSADEDDALKNTFFSPAVATNGGTLKYTWDFGDDTASVDTDYNYITHQFNKYGKTYTVKLLLNNMTSSQQETVTMDLKLPKPEISINCNTSGALIFCNPVISQQAVQDVSYTWNIFNSEGTLEKEILSAGPAIINHRVENSGVYKIVLTGTSAQVDGDMTAERNVYVSVNINQGQITYTNTSSDMLSYKYTFNAQAVDGSQLEYCWDFDGTSSCGQGAGYQLGAEYSIVDHTYGKYNASHTVTAYARIPGTDEVVNNSIVVTQPLPEVSIQAEGTGLTRTLSPVFSFRPKGSLSYIWKTGDGKEYSQETVSHTYGKNGTYTAELTVLNDLFAPEIGSISAQPVNVYAYGNIQNIVINSQRVSQSIEGETYTFSSPASSDTGKLYFTWKINNAVVAEGEGLSSINHTFTKYGQTASVSLELKIVGSNDIVSAEPVLVQTSKPTAVLNPPANVTVNIPAEFQGEVLSHLNGEDFSANLSNPQYKLEISNVEYKYSDSLTIPYTFITRGSYSAKLVVTADNVEGSIVSEPVTVQANEVLVVCRNEANPADLYSVKVICQMDNIIDKNLKYSLTFQPYMESSYTTNEYNAEDISEIILYNKNSENSLYRYSSRDIVVNWEIYKDKSSIEYMGSYQIKFNVEEPVIDKFIDIMSYNSEPMEYVYNVETGQYEYKSMISQKYECIYALSESGNVYSWGDDGCGQLYTDRPVLTPKVISSIDGKVVEMMYNSNGPVFRTDTNDYYMIVERGNYMYGVKNMPEKIIKFLIMDMNLRSRYYFISESRELYYVNKQGEIQNPINANIGKVKKVYYIQRNNGFDNCYVLTDDGVVYATGYADIYKHEEDIVDLNILLTNGLYGDKYITLRKQNGEIIDKASSLTLANNGKMVYIGANSFSIGEDKKLYHAGNVNNSDFRECSSGLGEGLSQETYTKVSEVIIPETIVDFLKMDRTNYAIAASGNLYTWGGPSWNSHCTPQLEPNIKINSKIKEVQNDIILLENGQLLTGGQFNNIEIPGEKIAKFYIVEKNSYQLFAITETKNVYEINYSTKEVNKVNKVKNISNVKDIKVLMEDAIIMITENNDVYAYGEKYAEALNIESNSNIEKYSAVKVEGIANPINFIHILKESNTVNYKSTYSILAFTQDGRIYGWGANNGRIPVGTITPQNKPVLLNVPLYKKGVYETNYMNTDSYAPVYYNILTENNDIYSWGYLVNTGTDAKENVAPNGYLIEPTKVN